MYRHSYWFQSNMLPHLDMGLKDKEVLGLLQLESKTKKQNLNYVIMQ